MNLAILFGGNSYEHEISIVSAITLRKVFTRKLLFIFCDENRDFYLIDEKNMKSNYFSTRNYLQSPKIYIAKNGFYKLKFLSKQKLDINCIINLIHGQDGEDGKIAALLEFFDINFIGPRIEGSAATYNKIYIKGISRLLSLKALPYEIANINKREVGIRFPVIVKPARLGSSIGISIANNEKEYDYALDVAFEFDKEVLIEKFYKNVLEVNLAGCKAGDEFIFSKFEVPNKGEILDFKQKYMDFSRNEIKQETNLSQNVKDQMYFMFKNLYDSLCYGAIIRCDFFVIDEIVYINEINPVPGSLANYLFDDFENMVVKLAKNLPKSKKVKIGYEYINNIQSAKGKA